jgi:hypothetical protein
MPSGISDMGVFMALIGAVGSSRVMVSMSKDEGATSGVGVCEEALGVVEACRAEMSDAGQRSLVRGVCRMDCALDTALRRGWSCIRLDAEETWRC